MNTSAYSVAQLNSARENSKHNIEKHMEYIKLAARHDSDLILFPELSLTGYERELARKQYFSLDDKRLDCFQKASVEHNITIVVGAPLLLEDHLYIASWIFAQTKNHIYIKKYLHPGEELYFNSSLEFDPTIALSDNQVSFAICYDIEIEEHIKSVKNRNSNYYAASIFYSKNGIHSGLKRLQYIAKEYATTVMMSNYVGTCWDTETGGRSTIWSRNGDVVISADATSECLLVAQNNKEKWMGEIVTLS
jgi:predicted amidohydrolase